MGYKAVGFLTSIHTGDTDTWCSRVGRRRGVKYSAESIPWESELIGNRSDSILNRKLSILFHNSLAKNGKIESIFDSQELESPQLL